MSKLRLEIESDILEALFGKITVLQSKEEKEKVVISAISETYGKTAQESFLQSEAVSELSTDEGRKKFIKSFFSYGIIDELLYNAHTEDIIINGLNYIYTHDTFRGLIKTDKKFSSQR